MEKNIDGNEVWVPPFTEPVMDLVEKRASCRKYSGEKLSQEERNELSGFLSEPHKGPFGNIVRTGLLAASDGSKEELQGLGTYGYIRGASAYIAGAVEDTAFALEDFGYVFEMIILYAASKGWATCWLGGSVRRSSFASKLKLAANEIMPAATPVGKPSESEGMLDKFVKWKLKPKNRKAFSELFFKDSFDNPLLLNSVHSDYQKALEAVRLAPSASNKQPWRVLMNSRENGEDVFHFYLERTPGYYKEESGKNSTPDLQRIDMGIAFAHFSLIMKESGKRPEWFVQDNINLKPETDGKVYVSSCRCQV